MRSLLADLTHAFRIYSRTPVASGLAILVLAVAMAFVTAFLSMYVDVGIKGHPGFEDAGELVTIGQTDGRQLAGLPIGVLGQMADDIRSLDAVGGVIGTTVPSAEEGQQPISMELVTDGFVSRETSPLAVTLAVVLSLVLLLSAASFGPARQAKRTQPAPLLRED